MTTPTPLSEERLSELERGLANWVADVWETNEFAVMAADALPALIAIARASRAGPAGMVGREAAELLKSVFGQFRADLKSAHAEICKLQGLDPETHTWPEWSPQANTLRWLDEIEPTILPLLHPEPSPGEGFVWAPREPTEAQLKAGDDAAWRAITMTGGKYQCVQAAYRAMIDAAPFPTPADGGGK